MLKRTLGLVLFLSLLSAPGALAAQRVLGEIAGTVLDPQGAVVAGARVTASDAGTGRSFSAESDGEGVYHIVALPPGRTYAVRVEADGFKPTFVQSVTVDVGETRRLDVDVVAGMTASNVVDVTLPHVDLERGERSSVVDRAAIEALPLNGRNVFQLAELQPGVVRVVGTGLQDSDVTGAPVSSGGARFRDNQFLIDGVTDNNDRQGGRTTIAPSPDAVEQFRVVTGNFSAEFGRSGGALVSLVTRSGSNRFHGSAFEYFRDESLDASTTFEARTGRKSPFQRNQFGGTVGGPISRDRAFFFVSYQGVRQERPTLRQVSVETPEFRDFVLRTRPSSLAARLLAGFPPSQDPQTNIRDIGSPAPGVGVSGPPDGIPDLGDVFVEIPGTVRADQILARVDWAPDGGATTVTARYTLDDKREQRPDDNSPRPFSVDFLERDQNASLGATHVFSPSVVGELRLGYNYDPQINIANYPDVPFVQFATAGRSASPFGQTFGYVFPLDFRLHTYQLYGALTVVRGGHAFKLGGEVRRFQENSEFALFEKPLVTFYDVLDFADDEPLSLQARVDPTTGRPTGTYRHFRSTEYALFAQDDWKVTSRLTLNLGLRYESFGTLAERDGLLSSLVVPGAGGLADARVVAVDRLYAPDRNDVAPRVGFAWDPTGAGIWAVRGGAGVYYSRVWSNLTGNTRFNPPFSLPVSLSALAGQDPSAYYAIPFAGGPGLARPLDARGGSPTLRPSVQTVDANLRTPYATEWFLGVEREVAGAWVLEANYVGSAGRKLLFRNQINRYVGDRADGRLDRIDPSFGTILHATNAATSSYHGLTAEARRRFKDGLSVQAAYTFGHSIDTDSEPFGGGPGEQAGSMDAADLALDRASSAFDVRHRFAANVVADIPFGWGGAAGALLGGWQASGIVSLQSGFPFTVVTSEDYNLDGDFSDRPNAAVALPSVVGSGPHDFLDGAFGDAAAIARDFRPAPLGTDAALGRNVFRGPGYASVDVAARKVVRLGSRGEDGPRLEIRVEAFNVFNRVNLGPPSNSLGVYSTAASAWSNASFGRSTTAFDARQVQLVARLAF